MNPKYLVTQELRGKSDAYRYGVLLLEIITTRLVVEENKNLVEWVPNLILEDSNLYHMVDPDFGKINMIIKNSNILSTLQECLHKGRENYELL